MSSLSDYAEGALLDHLFGQASFSQPTLYLALSTSDPGEDGSGLSEPSGNNYSRVSTGSGDWNRNGPTVENANDLAFPEASGNWGTVTHVALFDADTGGNMIAYTSLNGGGTAVEANDTVRFPAGNLTTTLD